ncbi:hypothetical protein [Azospirillum sp. A23]|uniref:hypothetical protein n=1 Tax=Azospirillum sp. A23 TaxID=3160608 RepID=UPI0036F23D47
MGSPSPVHCAHAGQDVDVHYRWHPLHGRRVRVMWSEARAIGHLVFVEAAPGIITVLPEWMLDPVICADMELGTPRVAVEALINLQRQLSDGGFRRSSPGDAIIVPEERHENAVSNNTTGQDPAPVQHGLRHRKAADDQPGRPRRGSGAIGPSPDGSRRCQNRGA